MDLVHQDVNLRILFLLWGQILPYPEDGLVQPKHIWKVKKEKKKRKEIQKI